MAQSHVFQLFSSYSYFTLNQDAPPTREFLRLKRLNHWENGDEEYIEARERFADALAEDFNATYGTDINNIDHWHTLCRVLRIDPIPEEISACRKVCEPLRKTRLIFRPLGLVSLHRLSSQGTSTSLTWFTTPIESGRFLRSKRLPDIQ